ncbi:MAG: lysophospholipid acyltransferase family protein [Rhodovibrionaceae bacterium]|nr:lysophospholipid acyltransferase family protein [Rhodovibrionaceae bacterium]
MIIGSPTRAALRILAYVGLTAPLMAAQGIALMVHRDWSRKIPYWYHRQCLKIFGIRVQRRGRKSREHPTLYVCNHASYLDIPVLASLIYGGSFVAKAEVAQWPLFGWLAKLQRTVFVERRSNHAARQRDQIAERLDADDDLILFPEGTSGDGNRVLPFKSALFSVAERRPHGAPLVVQPVSIAYTRLDGMPMGRSLRPFFAWYGDMELGPHVFEALGMGKLTVVVEFHKPATIDDFQSRKAMAEHCQRVVARGLASALSGHSQQLGQPPEVAGGKLGPAGQGGPQPA